MIPLRVLKPGAGLVDEINDIFEDKIMPFFLLRDLQEYPGLGFVFYFAGFFLVKILQIRGKRGRGLEVFDSSYRTFIVSKSTEKR